MPLTPGDRLGAYEIVAALGAGGMGEVYKARDTRLDRTVAIKVVTAALAGDSDLRLRFEYEARAIAALNHPHICTIHDVGRHEDIDFLVMEFLEGETLAERLKKSSPLPIAEALAIAIQIGTALDAAHRVGIVHRDLKPGNVMLVRGAGHGGPTAKLLDFGLATSGAPPPQVRADISLLATMAPSIVATRPPSATAPLGFSGTVQYMAPEQMDGQAVDQRADIFAFGCLLYEMLAGRKAFEGGTAMVVIAAIMNTDPPPIETLRTAPPVLEHLLRRCLEKDPERRWQSMGDVTGELRWIAEQPLTTAVPSARERQRTWWPIAAAFAVALVAMPLALLAGVRWLRPAEAPAAPAVQFEVTTPPTDRATVALSPDGQRLVFVGNRDGRPVLWLRSLDQVANRELPGTEDADNPFWSPDGRTIGFFADNKLKRIDVDGGTPLVLTDAPTARGGAWGPGGVILFAPGAAAPIMRISSSGGPVEAVTAQNAGYGSAHRQPQFLPDGKRFLFQSSLGLPETNGIYIGSLDKTAPLRILPTGPAVFAPPDKLLTIRQGAVVAYAFDPQGGRVEGEPVVVAQGGINDVSAAGDVLAYRAGVGQRRQLVWVTRQGVPMQAIGEPSTAGLGSPELSPDEREVAVFQGPSGDNDIWVIDLARQLPRRITTGPPADAHPIWDPDGRHVVFSGSRLGRRGQARQPVDGTGKAEPLLADEQHTGIALSWTRDRQFILLGGDGTQGTADLVAVSIDGRQSIPVAQTSNDETEGQFSPDGRWVAFVTNETGRPEVFVQSFPDARGRTQVSTTGGTQVRWSSDGREIFYIAPDGKMMSVAVSATGATPAPQPPVTLFQTRLATGRNVIGNKPQYAVSRDGRFLLNTALESASAPIIVTTSWMRALAR